MITHTLAMAAIFWSGRYTFEKLPLYINVYLNNEMI
jgi:hypothetical protein